MVIEVNELTEQCNGENEESYYTHYVQDYGGVVWY